MQPNQKLRNKDGVQVCLFPLTVINITQVSAPDSYSHCCGNAIDCVGIGLKANCYAPCDMVLIEVGLPQNGNVRTWQSQDEVVTPKGITYICVSFAHDDNPPYSNIGDKVSQGDIISHTGTTGFVTGDHTHLDQAQGVDKKLISYGITCASGLDCWALKDSIKATDIYYKNSTDILNTMGLDFKNFEEPPTPIEKRKFPFIFYMKRRY